MKVVIDTNVLISGLFFGGLPRRVLEVWADGRFELVVSPSIVDEYLRTCDRLGETHADLEYEETLAALIGHATLVPDDPAESITTYPDDDKFMLCARRAAAVVVSGDSDLLDVAGWAGVDVLRPRSFLQLLDKA